ncbi:glycosyltransferase family 4 protein [Desulfobulbus propionicus]
MKKIPQVLVCQRGARHRYAIPRMLEEAGMLEALYTDSSAYSLLGKAACFAEKKGLKNGRIRALALKKPQSVPRKKIFSTDLLALTSTLKLYGKSSLAYADVLASAYKKWGTVGANIVYTMNTADIPFLEYAKSEGLKIVVDVFVSPETEQIVEVERQRVFNTINSKQELAGLMRERYLAVFCLADILLCPSTWVADGCKKIAPKYADKIRVCPYGSSIDVADKPKVSSTKRVLFAGRDPLRKGLHYLADASAQLRTEGLAVNVVVAGVEKGTCRWIPNRDALNFLGHVPMNKMRYLFESSAVFVLPSLSEGQAGVVIEALSMGCPVVITRECGVDIEDGKQGFIVPARDAGAIALRVKELLSNPELQLQMSRNALEFAQQFSMAAWSDRLKSLCTEVVSI